MPNKRPTGGSAMRKTRMALPSAQEQLGQFYGFGPRQTAGISKITGVDNPFSNLPTTSQKAEFGEYSEILSLKDTMNFYEGQVEYNNMAGMPTEVSYQRQWEDVTNGEENATIPGAYGAQLDEDESPAPLTVVPTSTSNPDRPRTVAAGYDAEEEKITVVFRDGTFYNYYEVTPTQWTAFKARVSKGQYIYKYLDFHPRGLADVSQISATARKAFYKVARSSQIHSKGAKFKPLNTKRR